LGIDVDRNFYSELVKLVSDNALDELYFDDWLADKYVSRKHVIHSEDSAEVSDVSVEGSKNSVRIPDEIASIPDEYLQSSMTWSRNDTTSELVTPFGIKFSLSAVPYE